MSTCAAFAGVTVADHILKGVLIGFGDLSSYRFVNLILFSFFKKITLHHGYSCIVNIDNVQGLQDPQKKT